MERSGGCGRGVRLFGRADLARIAELIAAAFPADALPPETIERVLFSDPDLDPELCLAAERDGALAGIAAGVVRRRGAGDASAGGPRGRVKALAVAARFCGQGIGSMLLEEIERRLEARGARGVQYDGAAPCYFRPGLDAANARGREFLERRGYRVVEERESLAVDLTALDLDTAPEEERLSRAGFEVRRAGPEDFPALERDIAERFSADWAVEARLAAGLRPPALHLAIATPPAGGILAGFAAGRVCGPDIFGPMATAAEFRGRGIGDLLLRRALADIRGAGYRLGVIGWAGPREYYRKRVGARPAYRYLVMEKRLGS